MNNKGHIISEIIMAVVILLLLFSLRRQYFDGGTEKNSDTVYIHSTDTLYLPKDSIIYKWKKVTDTLYLPKDTTLLVEQKYYEDSLSGIWISGVNPEIDSIKHFIPRDTVVVTNEITHTVIQEVRSGWGITIGGYAGGGGYVINGQVGVAPEIGLGCTVGWTYIFKHRKHKKQNYVLRHSNHPTL